MKQLLYSNNNLSEKYYYPYIPGFIELPILLGGIHKINYPRLWLVEGEAKRIIYELIPIPRITSEQRITHAIKVIQKIYKDSKYNFWANNWLSNIDRTNISTYEADCTMETELEARKIEKDIMKLSDLYYEGQDKEYWKRQLSILGIKFAAGETTLAALSFSEIVEGEGCKYPPKFSEEDFDSCLRASFRHSARALDFAKMGFTTKEDYYKALLETWKEVKGGKNENSMV